jgi:glycosyltransferase involved in cell wall biosynthesis
MRLLFLTQRYPPEIGTASNRISDLAERLASFGHDVTVLAALPNHPEGKIFDGYRGRLVMEERRQDVRIIRTWIYASNAKGVVRRLLNYFSFVVTSMFGALAKVGRQDAVFVASPPLFLGISGLVLKWFWRSKMVFNVADLWPKSAVDLGVVTSPRLIRISSALENALYRGSDLITCQTKGIVADIQQRTKTAVLLCTNGIDASSIFHNGNREESRRQFGLREQDFVIGYAGLHGLAQGLDLILAAAEKVQDHDDVKFVLFGDGPEKRRLTKAAKDRGLKNVAFFPPQPKSRMPEIMNAIDVSLVPLRRLDLFKSALPGKMFESMGAGVPVIVSIEGEAKELVELARGGICIPPEDPRALVDAVLFLRDNPEIRHRMGDSGKKFIVARYDRKVTARSVELAIAALMTTTAPSEPAGVSSGQPNP